MGNNAYLLNHYSARPLEYTDENRVELLAAKNQIPILWLALFSEANISHIEVPMQTNAGEKVTERVPTLFATGFEWAELYRARKSVVDVMIPKEFVQYVGEWDAFMQTHLKLPSVQLELTEINMLSENLDDDLRAFLSAFSSSQSANWLALLDQANLDDAAPYGIRGFPYQTELDWK